MPPHRVGDDVPEPHLANDVVPVEGRRARVVERLVDVAVDAPELTRERRRDLPRIAVGDDPCRGDGRLDLVNPRLDVLAVLVRLVTSGVSLDTTLARDRLDGVPRNLPLDEARLPHELDGVERGLVLTTRGGGKVAPEPTPADVVERDARNRGTQEQEVEKDDRVASHATAVQNHIHKEDGEQRHADCGGTIAKVSSESHGSPTPNSPGHGA